MFKNAYLLASQYTKPFIVSIRYFDQTVECGLGSYIVLNDDGWLMTAAHNFNAAFLYQQHQQEIASYQQQHDAIKLNKEYSESEQIELLKNVQTNPKWVIHFSILLNGSPIHIHENFVYGEHDLALFRIDSVELIGQTVYPTIVDSRTISPGTSLCKLGFPFVQINATFDISSNQFLLPKNVLPIPFFPIEGIYTRNFFKGKSTDGSMDILFLETSSPGLKGQSGGPIFDTRGVIYAVQSQNITIALGFTGKGLINGVSIEENQYLNMGIGVHPLSIELLLKKHHIRYRSIESA